MDKLKVVGYVRVSTNKQDFESQKSEIRFYAEKEGFDLIQIFEDKVTGSSANLERLGFSMMMEFLEKNTDINSIIFDELSRMGRNNGEQYFTYRLLKQKGITIYTKGKGKFRSGSKEDDLHFNMLSTIAEFEKATILDRFGRGKRNVLNKKATQLSRNIYGYTINFTERESGKEIKRQSLSINETEATVVKKIFELVAEGRTLTNVRSYLKKKNILTINGREIWGKSTLQKILHSRTYIGEWEWGKKYKGMEDGRYIIVPVPVIVDKEVFDKVQKQLILNKTVYNRKKGHKNMFLLKGILFNQKGLRFQTNIENGKRQYRDPERNIYSSEEEGILIEKKNTQITCIDADYLEDIIIYCLLFILNETDFFDTEKEKILSGLKEKNVLTILENEESKILKQIENNNKERERHIRKIDELEEILNSSEEDKGEVRADMESRMESKSKLYKEKTNLIERLTLISEEKKEAKEKQKELSFLDNLKEGLSYVVENEGKILTDLLDIENQRVKLLTYIKEIHISERLDISEVYNPIIKELKADGFYSSKTDPLIQNIYFSVFGKEGGIKKLGTKFLEININFSKNISKKIVLKYYHKNPFFYHPRNYSKAIEKSLEKDKAELLTLLKLGQGF
ncbi:MAG: recombinase family protein [Candidatus Gracilibacteria bacterium]|nr:recombinase family protein [Candidatus Gracilibacteria bacterium]